MISEGLIDCSNNYEREYRSKRRPHVRLNGRERSAPSSMAENTEGERRSHGSCKWRKRPIQETLPLGSRNMTRREAADESGVLFRRSSPGPPRGVADTDRQVMPGSFIGLPTKPKIGEKSILERGSQADGSRGVHSGSTTVDGACEH
ncbi:hypothetical protein NPIL_562621 [Nephila pilipes]|uniref:Uncharacterized protein n=1 Tax=Nephila pilipes TaxID=299642 RepID=A0A8X6TPS6_NEPPI|nr:hypothetical protein NPIL_562621 [Nephila pilipes]